MNEELIDTVIECSIDQNELLIDWQKKRYHQLCNDVVDPIYPVTRCIKRVGHLSCIHEDWLGQTAVDQPTLFDQTEGNN